MKNYVILTDSCSDLPKELREKYGVEYLPMRILYGDKDIPADLDWGEISFEQFYALMRDGVRIKTSQVNASEYVAAFEKYAGEGLAVLQWTPELLRGARSAVHNGFKTPRRG